MILTIIAFILILGLIIFVHEFGHFLAAKKFGIAVEEFGFGFPPRLISKKFKGTIYSLNLIPLGGFVKIKGESGEKTTDPDSFQQKKIWQRLIIVAAGVLMNLLLAMILISIGYSLGLPTIIDEQITRGGMIKNQQLQIIEVLELSPADKVGINFGDIILQYDQQQSTTVEDFKTYIQTHSQQEINLQIKRGKEILNFSVQPQILTDFLPTPSIGIGLAQIGLVAYPWYKSLWYGIKNTIDLTGRIIVALFMILKDLIITKKVTTEIAGPVGIAFLTGQVVNLGFIYVLQFTALLSINLAIVNFLPLPALDGGRFTLLIIEKIRKKAINYKIEALIHNLGFILLLLLVIFISFKDFQRYSETVKNFLQNIL